jgi:hypothetical protein
LSVLWSGIAGHTRREDLASPLRGSHIPTEIINVNS